MRGTLILRRATSGSITRGGAFSSCADSLRGGGALCTRLARGVRRAGDTSRAPKRSRAARQQRRQKKNANPSFHSSTSSFWLRFVNT